MAETEYPETVEEVDLEAEHEEDAGAEMLPVEEDEPEPHLVMLRWSRSIGNLIGAMAQASQEYGEAIKESENPFFKNSASGGKYADLAALIGATRSPLGKYGVVVSQFPALNPRGKVAIATFIAHKSGEWMLGLVDDLPVGKPDIHGIGSGFTYARRYAYGPAVNIAAEDDDGNLAVASRKEALAKLEPKMDSQARISSAQAIAFDNSCKERGRTPAEIKQFLEQLNGYQASTEITKQHWNEAIKWAVATKTEQQAEQPNLAPEWEKSVDFVKLNKELRAAAAKHEISNTDIHKFIEEHYHAESLKDLSVDQLKQTIRWVDEQ